MRILNFLRQLTGKRSLLEAPVSADSPTDNQAAATLAWSFREMFKYRDGQGEMSAWNELGWWLSQALCSAAHWRDSQTYLEDPLGLKAGYDGGDTRLRCEPLVQKIADPVITTLWEIGTLRALSDMLAHLVLRAEQPGILRWNTADHVKAAHGVDLYAINDAYLEKLKAGSPA